MLKTVMALKHGDRPVFSQTNRFSSSIPSWTFHNHWGDLPELAHFTSHGPGLAWLPTMEPEQEKRALFYSVVADGIEPQVAQAGDFVNFLPPLIHSGPIATPEDNGQRHFALGHLTPAN